ncbi:MAG: hypothetical protein ACXVEF_43475 [Polyangiales bacterium]
MKVTLKLRDLGTGDPAVTELESVEAATAWVRARPRFVEVLGVVFEGMTREESLRMKEAMRPLDGDERGLLEKLEARKAAEVEARDAARQKELERAAAQARIDAQKADPNRPMQLVYRAFVGELRNADPLDERPITEAAREAVMAFVREREEWVVGRGQTVGEAKVTVYPNAVPAKEERIVAGTFVPVTRG